MILRLLAATTATATILLGADQTGAPTGSVRVTFTEDGAPAVTAVSGTIYFDVPGGGSRQRLVTSFTRPFLLESMPVGAYRFTIVAQSRTSVLVAAEVQSATVTSGGVSVVTMDLVRRAGDLVVVDASGRGSAGAHYYTNPSAVNSTADDDGRVGLAMLATGTFLTVRTIQWGVTCHRVTAEPAQRVVVPDADDALVIVTSSVPMSGTTQRRGIASPLLAGAWIEGVPGADCPIRYEHLPVTLSRVGGATEHTVLLPAGPYTVSFSDGRTLAVRAPGRLDLR